MDTQRAASAIADGGRAATTERRRGPMTTRVLFVEASSGGVLAAP